MEKDFGSWWFHPQHSDRQPPNLNSLSPSFDYGLQNTVPGNMHPSANAISLNGALASFGYSALPYSKANQPSEPRGWFYCLPRFRQAFAPVLNSGQKEKLPASLDGGIKGAGATNVGSGCAQKRFVVVDQSGDQTTLFFSSGIGTPIQCPSSWNLKPPVARNMGELGARTDASLNPYGPYVADKYDEENHGDDAGSEMREDSEELNALLYSDDDYEYSDDEETTSTGHSPSTMTANDKQEWLVESGEEVASSAGLTKRQKLSDGCYCVPSLVDTASSVKPEKCFEKEDDAESSCGGCRNTELGEFGSLSGSKRSQKEKIRETISILQSLIPNGKGKDAIVVLDEAICYLKSLKLKLKSSGIDTL